MLHIDKSKSGQYNVSGFGIEWTKEHETFDKIQKICEKAGAAGQCRLVIGEGGHRFYADASWPVFKELTNW